MSNRNSEIVIVKNNPFIQQVESLAKLRTDLYLSNIHLPTVPTEGGLFGWFDHKVTGEEMNDLTETIQSCIINTNQSIVKMIQQLWMICDIFSNLDQQYLLKFAKSIEIANATIDNLKDANERIRDQQKNIKGAQRDIRQTVDQQAQMIQKLGTLHQRLKNIRHLDEIDNLFDEFHALQKQVYELGVAFTEHTSSIANLEKTQKNISGSLKVLYDKKSFLKQEIKRLDKTDLELKSVSSDLEEAIAENKTNYTKMALSVNQMKKDHSILQKSFDGQQNDIMRIFALQDEYATDFSALKESNNEMSNNFTQLAQKTDAAIAQLANDTDKKHEMAQKELADVRNPKDALAQSLRWTKGIAISSLGFSLVLFILVITGALR